MEEETSHMQVTAFLRTSSEDKKSIGLTTIQQNILR
jgi:hypothetical protein